MGYPIASCKSRVFSSQATGVVLLLDETGLGSPTAAYSWARKLRSAYGDTQCVRGRRASDNAEADFGFISNELTSSCTASASTGGLYDGQTLATFFSGTDGFEVTRYDQSGNGNHITQSTASLQYQFVSSGALMTGSNSKPRGVSSGTRRMTLPNAFSGLTTGYVMAVLRADGNGTPHWGFGSVGNDFYPYTDGKIYDAFATTARKDNITPAATISNFTMYTVLSASGNWTCWHNNSQSFTTATNTVGWDTTPTLEAGTISWHELVIWGSDKSGSQTTAFNNVDAFYALP